MNVLYVSYDGTLDPLGASQIVPYLERLGRRGVALTLVSYEKPERWADKKVRHSLQQRLELLGITWRPLTYHRRPRVPATLWDLLRGAAAIRREMKLLAPQVVHCRGDIATAMARLACPVSGPKLLYDIRGFWSDERAETGSWRAGSLLDRSVRKIEAGSLARADGIVVLTHSALAHLSQRRSPLPPFRVIPTCVDLDRFRRPQDVPPPDRGPVYCGSFGPRYLPAQTVAFARVLKEELGQPALFLTPHRTEAQRAGVTPDWADLLSLKHSDVPGALARGRALLFFYQPGIHTLATCPTRVGEALAMGLPVAFNAGIGDLDNIIEREGVGVVVREFTATGYREATARLRALLQDRTISDRCRRLAESHFDVESGADRYLDLYRTLCTSS